MRHVRLPVALVGTLCALAVTAAPAMAEGFIANGGTVTQGTSSSTQTFKFGEFKGITIKCSKVTSTGTVVEGTPSSLIDVISPKKCTFASKGVKFVTPIEIEYKNPEKIEEGNEAKILSAVEIKVSAYKCLLTIDAQELPGSEFEKTKMVGFTDELVPGKSKKLKEKFPLGQSKLLIANKAKGLEWETESVKEEHGACAEMGEPSGENGTWVGELRDEIKEGNLGV